MDRRHFFKSLLATPLMTPLILAAKKSARDAELYLISASPQQTLPALLQEIRALGIISGRSYAIQGAVPQEKILRSALEQAGWKMIPARTPAHMSISTRRLQNQALPSFTLVQGGRIWDIRTPRLSPLCKEINRSAARSSLLTVVSFWDTSSARTPGESVSLFVGGERAKILSLRTDTIREYRTRTGRITVRVENGRARVSESSCSHKICVSCPPASFPGERIICAPNHFLLEVNGPSLVDTIIG